MLLFDTVFSKLLRICHTALQLFSFHKVVGKICVLLSLSVCVCVCVCVCVTEHLLDDFMFH